MFAPAACKRFFLVLLAAVLLQAPLARAALISLQPDTTFAGPGDSFSLAVVVSDLGSPGPDSLGAFDITVGFDAGVLAFTGYTLGNLLGNLGLAEALDASAGGGGGSANVAEVSLLPAATLDLLQPASFSVATLQFDVIGLAPGASTAVSVQPGAILGDAFGSPLAVTGLGSASIQAAPAPGTLVLLVTSLVGWRVFRRAPVGRA